MSRRIFTRGRVEQGVLFVKQTRPLRAALEKWPTGDVRVTVEKDTRNLRQNSLMWYWWTLLGNEIGEDPQRIHEITKLNCNAKTTMWTDKKTGEIHEATVGMSTADLPFDAFSEFLERARIFWGEQGYALPVSEEGTWR
jgi:hypothetical protein